MGDSLVPLSVLRATLPEVAAKAEEKYQGRGHVPKNQIPLLGCNWEDTVFLSPIHPQVLHGLLVSCGHRGLIGRRAFVIDHTLLDPDYLVVYEFDGEAPYDHYDPKLHMRYSRIREATKGAYRDALDEGKKPFIFAGVTHVFYLGQIPIAGLPVVEVRK
jgi:hypothetical protein